LQYFAGLFSIWRFDIASRPPKGSIE
jgi:hypothetical protein